MNNINKLNAYCSIVIIETYCQVKSLATYQTAIGILLGIPLSPIVDPLANKIVRSLGVTRSLVDPFQSMSLRSKIIQSPLICLAGPILEEIMFRGLAYDYFKIKICNYYVESGLKKETAQLFSRITMVFTSSILFGAMHFTNALMFWCHPVYFLHQVIAATMMGFLLASAKELTGKLDISIGMHIGNNTAEWMRYIKKDRA